MITINVTLDTQTNATVLLNATRRVVDFATALGLKAEDVSVDAADESITFTIEVDT